MRIVLGLLAALTATAQPLIDYHQHFLNHDLDAAKLIGYLDEAGIRRALVLSVAYQLANPNRPPVDDEFNKVKAENDWTGAQVALYPDRLRGFCGFNPLREYAIREMQRCAADPRLKYGIKLHFGNSDVDLDKPEHVAQMRRVFGEANRLRMAIVVHMHSSVTMKRPYGAKQARIFLEQLLPAAPDIPIQIAHLAGAGGFDDPTVDEALGVFVDAIAGQDKRMSRVYFDASSVAHPGQTREQSDQIAKRLRQLGVGRVLYGTDGATPGNSPRDAWAVFRKLPLTDAEFHTIEANVAPYMK